MLASGIFLPASRALISFYYYEKFYEWYNKNIFHPMNWK